MSSFLFFAFTTDDFFCRAPELALGQDRYRDLFHQSPSLIAVLLISVSALGRRVGHPPVLRQRWFSSDSLQIKKIARNAEDYFSFFPWHNGKGFPGTCHRLTFLVSYWISTCLEDLENTDSSVMLRTKCLCIRSQRDRKAGQRSETKTSSVLKPE